MLLKAFEIWAKNIGALLLALLLYRPGRQRLAQKNIQSARRILVVRLDNRVGEALLSTPLLTSLRANPHVQQIDILAHEKVARVLEGHPDASSVLAFDARWAFLGPWAPGIRALRKRDYDVVIHASNWTSPSVSGAIVTRLLAPRATVLGFDVWPARALQDINVPIRADTVSEVRQRVHLLSVVPGCPEVLTLSFRSPRTTAALDAFSEKHLGTRPYAVINPGGRLGQRRVPPEVFARAARVLLDKGMLPVVTWGPNEEALAQQVLGLEGRCVLAPPTNLDELACLMKGATVTVCNNTGPMHLSVAVGTPTFALFFRMPKERWGHFYGPHHMFDLTPAADARVPLESVLEHSLSAWLAGH